MLFVGYFEGLKSHRLISWRCSDSRSIGEFLGLSPTDPAPLGDLLPPHVINCHIHVPHDVEGVEHVQDLGNLFRDHVEVRLPHVAAHETDAGPAVVGEHLEELSQTLLGALMRYPEQSLDAGDLVDEREIGMAAATLDLVHADRLDAREIPVGHSPQHRMFHRAKHVLPRRVEGDYRLRPRQPLRPPGREPKVAFRQVPLAVSPWHTPDGHAAGRTINPPHRVDAEHRHVPERDDLKPSGGKPVIAGPLLAAARADGPPVGPGLDVHLQERLDTRTFDQSLLSIDEGLERLDAIENTLEVHPAVAAGKGCPSNRIFYRKVPQDAPFSPWSARRAVLPSGGTPPHASVRSEWRATSGRQSGNPLVQIADG